MGILILISTEPLSRPNPSESSNIEFTFHQSFLTAILTIKTTNAQVNKILQKRKKKNYVREELRYCANLLVSCRPHSVFALPFQRPARSSSPSLTGCVEW